MAPIATDSSSNDSSRNSDSEEEGARGGDVFLNGEKISKEEDAGRDEAMALAFGKLKVK